MEILEHVALASLTTFGVGGPARFFVRVHTQGELTEALAFAAEKNLKVFLLGGGSNTLFADEGFDGLVIKVEILGVEQTENIFVAGAGESWDALALRAVTENLWGIENLSGIPGTVGGAVVQNIGAYGAALSQTVVWVEARDTRTGEIKRFTNAECAFGYRQSIFKQAERYVVLRAAFQLAATPAPNLSYKDLALLFADRAPGLAEIREGVIVIRKSKFPDLGELGTAGSFFENPVVLRAQAEMLVQKYPGMPVFALPESPDVKIPIAWLLDHRHGVLDLRDVRVGGAHIFENHALVIVAQKNTKSSDVRELAHIIQRKVKDVCAIEIKPEVHVV